ncbi:TPA: hypothetical protein ACXDAZ_004110 [Clostridium botulinum]|uniref:hypothetical protein n=1 Tax=Clostridium botulinum TaxID=1491 RepID=UPI000909CCE3|nr:hypothetical protein [Clostridium botulinum]APC81197.1 hypothetical protein NPD2_225 [Clostridium botulinum]MCS4463314.1 hypothetical protein [Clostridium botulinum]
MVELKGSDNVKWFGIDFGIKYIIFETNEKQYIVDFKIDKLGNITNVGFAEGEIGSMVYGERKIKIKSISPNTLGKIMYLMDLIREKTKVQMHKIFHLMLKKS